MENNNSVIEVYNKFNCKGKRRLSEDDDHDSKEEKHRGEWYKQYRKKSRQEQQKQQLNRDMTSRWRKRKLEKAYYDELTHMERRDKAISIFKQRKRQKAIEQHTYRIAWQKQEGSVMHVDRQNIGSMNHECEWGCGAVHFSEEKTRFICCRKGECIEALSPPPPFMQELLQNAKFRNGIRHYNCTFRMTTLGSTLHDIQTAERYPFFIRVHGMVYHSVPPAVAPIGQRPRFLQLYIIDETLEELLHQEEGLDNSIVSRIVNYIMENNPFAKSIGHHVQQVLLQRDNIPEVRVDIEEGTGRYNAPTVKQVAAVLTQADLSDFCSTRSILLDMRPEGTFRTINDSNPICDPMTYPIMFLHGEKGYSNGLHYQDGKKVTRVQYAQQRIQNRPTQN